MADKYLKFAYGKYDDIPTALDEGEIDERDIVVTSDTDEIFYVDDDGVPHSLGKRTERYSSYEEALEGINEDDSTYAGQQVVVMDDAGKYEVYIVQNSDNGDGYTLEQVTAEQSELMWHEF